MTPSFLGLIQNGTLKPMRRPAKVRVLPLKEIASQKSDGRCKWRGCVMGNLMRPGVDFTKTFANVVQNETSGASKFVGWAQLLSPVVFAKVS